MKKFSKLLALGLAAVMTFGMTVSAAESAGDIAAAEEEAVKDAETIIPEGTVFEVGGEKVDVNVKAEPLSGSERIEAEKKVASPSVIADIQSTLTNSGVKVAADKAPVFVGAVVINNPGFTEDQLAKGVTIPLTVPGGVKSNMKYIVLHDGAPKVATVGEGNVIYVTVYHFSEFVIVGQEVADETPATEGVPAHVQAANDAYYNNRPYNQDPAKSPQTGEALPMVAIMALICLAGAAVCARKVSFNK